MPTLNWDAFVKLPGGAEANFEMLCRALVRRHYARYGEFRALASQPGVEFHLNVNSNCPLGGAGRWYGWQCRWYDLPGGRALGTSRRKKIAEAIALTEQVLPELTDWVLWTRRPLTEGDQKWFFSLTTHMRLHLWTAAEIEDHLSGEAAILRATYFGELVLTPEILAHLHEVSVAPVRIRWNPAVHQVTTAERELRKMLAEPGTWCDLQRTSEALVPAAKAITTDLRDLPDPLFTMARNVAGAAEGLAGTIRDLDAALGRGDLERLAEAATNRAVGQLNALGDVPRRLRAYRHPSALTVTNALSDIRRAHSLIEQVESRTRVRLVAVTAEAGCGKTELSVHLTSRTKDRPAGILLHGRNLSALQTLDDLARTVVVQGCPVSSMEALVAAIDAAGRRSHCRLPIVIDGLNEAEDSRRWGYLLAGVDELLGRYPYVLVICTLRTAYAAEALPQGTRTLDIPDFDTDAAEAVGRYFAFYRINATDAALPWELLRHPLTLRLFCEVTNPTRQHVVGVEAMPSSLSALLDSYLQQALERITELTHRDWRYCAQDVRNVIHEIGWALWEGRARALDFAGLRRILGDEVRPWQGSIVRLLEQEGILFRSRGYGSWSEEIIVAFDALAGHLIADALLSRFSRSEFLQCFGELETLAGSTGANVGGHPLKTDILKALVGLFPRRLHGQQLWPLLSEPLQSAALLWSADLEAAYLDVETVAQLGSLVAQPVTRSRHLFDRLLHTRSSAAHPLNAHFLDGMLRPMSVAERDLRWTEWVRRRAESVLRDLEQVERRWHKSKPRSESDRLRAQWLQWILTSSSKEIRDRATRALYWFGRSDPAALFALAVDSLAINDTSVSERMLAATYGVVMAHQVQALGFGTELGDLLTGLLRVLAAPAAVHPTSHWLVRLYVQGIVTFALTYYPDSVPPGMAIDGKFLFAAGPKIHRIEQGDPRVPEIDGGLNRHFSDDTLSRLIGFRRPFRPNEHEHDVVAHLRGLLWTFGWREAGLGAVDKEIAASGHRDRLGEARQYSDKYAWIGLFTYSEVLTVYSHLSEKGRVPDLQIDPSFPEQPPSHSLKLPVWSLSSPTDDRQWLSDGHVALPDDLFRVELINDESGPWIAAFGYLSSRAKRPNRGVFGYLSALLVDTQDAQRLTAALASKDYPGDGWLPHVPDSYYVFAGELPWHPEFTRLSDDEEEHRYVAELETASGSPIEVEILAHHFSWEGYHSPLNSSGGAYVPSARFSRNFDLRGVPQRFDQCLPDGTFATISLDAPGGFDGRLLYVREDLMRKYAGSRKLVWFIWGERNLYNDIYSPPSWLVEAHRARANVWRRIVPGEQLSSTLAGNRTSKRRARRHR